MRKPVHILLEGADGTGKTSIALRLQTATGFPIIKMPNMKEYIEKHSAEEFSKLYNETIVQFSKYDFIMDRGFPSSVVYSKVFDRDFDLSYLEKVVEVLDPMVYILTRSKNNHREDDIHSKDDVINLDLEYTKLANRMGYTIIDTSNVEKRKVTDRILRDIINRND